MSGNVVPDDVGPPQETPPRTLIRSERRTVFLLIGSYWLIIKVMQLLRITLLDEPLGANLAQVTILSWATFQLISIIPYGVICYGIYFVQSRFRKLPVPAQVGVAAACSFGGVLAMALASLAMNWLMYNEDVATSGPYVFRQLAVNGWLPLAFYTTAILTLLHSYELRLRDQRASVLEIQAREERLRALRYQVDPHFLYNSLNSLSALILARRSNDAENMALSLARYFRSSLTLDPAAVIPLEQEIRLLHEYLDLENIRTGDQLRLTVDLPADLQAALVPNLILQPLVENSVKHGLASTEASIDLAIRVHAAQARLIIDLTDNGSGDGEHGGGTGVGLENVRQRLRSHFGSEARFEAAPLEGRGFRARIEIPLRLGQPDLARRTTAQNGG